MNKAYVYYYFTLSQEEKDIYDKLKIATKNQEKEITFYTNGNNKETNIACLLIFS